MTLRVRKKLTYFEFEIDRCASDDFNQIFCDPQVSQPLATPRLTGFHLLHSATSTFEVNEVEHINYIAFDKNAGLSQQQAHAKR